MYGELIFYDNLDMFQMYFNRMSNIVWYQFILIQTLTFFATSKFYAAPLSRAIV